MRLVRQGRWLVPSVVIAAALWAGVAQGRPPSPPPAQGGATAAPGGPSAVAEINRLSPRFKELYLQGDYPAALPIARRCLRLAEQRLGSDHPEVATWLNNLAAVHHAQGRLDESLDAMKRAIAVRKKHLAADDPRRGLDLHNLGRLTLDAGDPAAARGLLQEAVTVLERSPTHEVLLLSTFLRSLGDAHGALREFDRAEQSYRRALEIRRAEAGPDHVLVAEVRHSLGRLFKARGQPSVARTHYEDALRIEEKSFGKADPRLASSLSGLALVDEALGQYSNAEARLRRLMRIEEQHLGPEHPNVAATATSLGSVLMSLGKFREAESVLERAVRIFGRHEKPGSRQLSTAQMNLAMVHGYRGDYGRAAQSLRQLLDAQDKHLGSDHLDLAATLGNLAEIELERDNYGDAKALLERALDIRERALGPTHPAVAQTLVNLGAALGYLGDLPAALAISQRVVQVWTTSLGADHPKLATALNNQAQIEEELGHDEAARGLYRRALGILERRGLHTVPARAQVLENLALLEAGASRLTEALDSLERAQTVQRRLVSLLLSVGSERQQLALVSAQAAKLSLAVGIHLHAAPRQPRAARLALTTLLRRKGMVLDVVSRSYERLRGRLDAQDRKLFDELSTVRTEWAGAVFGNRELDAKRTAELRGRAEDLERGISARSAELAVAIAPVTIDQVQGQIPADAALVEFVSYSVPVSLRGDSAQGGRRRYAAYVLRRTGEPLAVPLGPADQIDALVGQAREAMADPNRWEVKRLARAVDKRLMQPIRSSLGDAEHLLIAPDGALNLLPFEALVDERDQYLIQRYAISYLTSGRDLVRLQLRHPSRSGVAVLANPSFGSGSVDPETGDSSRKAGADGATAGAARLRFGALPETALEAQGIHGVFPEATVLTEARATKAALRGLEGPRILHLATHGFFLGGPTAAESATGRRGYDIVEDRPTSPTVPRSAHPLLQSGLALSGANRSASTERTGVLTALEVAALDLRGTRLVVLSACETGLGKVERGEGVFGLRRALVMAGAETQVMSMWKVSDEPTRRLMVGYYRHLVARSGRAAALRQEQLAMLADPQTAHPHYWAGFIVSGAWGPLDGSEPGPPPAKPAARGCACRVVPVSGGSEPWVLGSMAMLLCAAARRRRRRLPRQRSQRW